MICSFRAKVSSRFSVVNLHHENGKVRLRMIHEIAPVADAMTVSPSLEDLFLYHFGEEAGIERREYRYIIGRMDIMPHMWQQNPCPNQKSHIIRQAIFEDFDLGYLLLDKRYFQSESSGM